MRKVKLSSMTATGLLLILLIGVIGYGCASNKSLESANSIRLNNSHQTTSLATVNNKPINKNELGSADSSMKSATFNNDSNNLSPTNNEQTGHLNSENNSNDRLRPEIKRILQAKFSNEAELQTALNGASILQDYLDRPDQDAVAMIKRYDCSVVSLTQADQNLIQSLTFDTDERKDKIKSGLKDYKPAVSIEIQIDNQGNAVSPCSAIR